MKSKLYYLQTVLKIQCIWFLLFAILTVLASGELKNFFYFFIKGIIAIPLDYIELFNYPQVQNILILLLLLTIFVTVLFLKKQDSITIFLFYLFYAVIWALPGYLFFNIFTYFGR